MKRCPRGLGPSVSKLFYMRIFFLERGGGGGGGGGSHKILNRCYNRG